MPRPWTFPWVSAPRAAHTHVAPTIAKTVIKVLITSLLHVWAKQRPAVARPRWTEPQRPLAIALLLEKACAPLNTSHPSWQHLCQLQLLRASGFLDCPEG